MTATTVVNLRREPYDVYIGRGSIMGNPFTDKPSKLPVRRFSSLSEALAFLVTQPLPINFVIPVSSRAEAITWYREYLISRADLMRHLPGIKGKRLGCYCKPLDCHGDVLAELAEYLAQV